MKKRQILFIICFLGPLTLMAVLVLALPAKSFSQNENRLLAKKPEISISNVADGSFQSDFEGFIGDQLPLREKGISLSTFIQKLVGKREINNVYIGNHHYCFNKFTNESYSKTHMNSVFQMIETFSQNRKVPVSVMLVPTPDTIISEDLPKNAPYYNDDAVYMLASQSFGDNLIDLRPSFLEGRKTNQIYYHTDHHWTTNGAYLAYVEYCKHVGIEPTALNDFKLEKVTGNFYGTIYSKVLDKSAVPDAIYIAKNVPDVKITYDGKISVTSPYDYNFLVKKDKYAMFFGGNHALVQIETPTKNDKTLLVIKDSFANSFVPFLLQNYEKIIMVDLRYCDKSTFDLISNESVSDILFLYETTNLLTDKDIGKLPMLENCLNEQESEGQLAAKPDVTSSPVEQPQTSVETPSNAEADSVLLEISELQNINKLFIGDSRTVGLEQSVKIDNADYFATVGMTVYKAPNDKVPVYGIGKVSLAQLLSVKKYDVVYIMMGINELGCSFENNVKAFQELVQLVNNCQPNAKIVIIGNLHVTQARTNSDKYINNVTINNFNAAISQLANNQTIFYLDGNYLFDDANGNLSDDKSSDNAHLKPQYYRQFAQWIVAGTDKIINDEIV